MLGLRCPDLPGAALVDKDPELPFSVPCSTHPNHDHTSYMGSSIGECKGTVFESSVGESKAM